MKKGVCLGTIPGGGTLEVRFKLAKSMGFDGVEIGPLSDEAQRQ